MNINDLRRRFGDILRQAVPPGSLEVIIREADAQGRVQNREIIRMIVALYNYLEAQEDTPVTKAIEGEDLIKSIEENKAVIPEKYDLPKKEGLQPTSE